jgi:hypothetical protein
LAEQSNDLKATDGKKLLDQFPNWLLFLISALAIFFSPYSISGYFMGFSSFGQVNLVSWAVEIIFFIVGIIPFAILDIRGKRSLMLLIGIFAFVDVGLYWLGLIFVSMAQGLST